MIILIKRPSYHQHSPNVQHKDPSLKSKGAFPPWDGSFIFLSFDAPDPPLVGSPISLSIGGLDPVGFGFLIVLSFGGSYPSLWGTLDGLSRDLASISLIRIMKMDKIVKNFIMANEGTKVTN